MKVGNKMAKIKILDESISNIIAAGEVVENPSSMIKELLENEISIDLAQRVLNYPIERAFNSLTNEDEGDDEE